MSNKSWSDVKLAISDVDYHLVPIAKNGDNNGDCLKILKVNNFFKNEPQVNGFFEVYPFENAIMVF